MRYVFLILAFSLSIARGTDSPGASLATPAPNNCLELESQCNCRFDLYCLELCGKRYGAEDTTLLNPGRGKTCWDAFQKCDAIDAEHGEEWYSCLKDWRAFTLSDSIVQNTMPDPNPTALVSAPLDSMPTPDSTLIAPTQPMIVPLATATINALNMACAANIRVSQALSGIEYSCLEICSSNPSPYLFFQIDSIRAVCKSTIASKCNFDISCPNSF